MCKPCFYVRLIFFFCLITVSVKQAYAQLEKSITYQHGDLIFEDDKVKVFYAFKENCLGVGTYENTKNEVFITFYHKNNDVLIRNGRQRPTCYTPDDEGGCWALGGIQNTKPDYAIRKGKPKKNAREYFSKIKNSCGDRKIRDIAVRSQKNVFDPAKTPAIIKFMASSWDDLQNGKAVISGGFAYTITGCKLDRYEYVIGLQDQDNKGRYINSSNSSLFDLYSASDNFIGRVKVEFHAYSLLTGASNSFGISTTSARYKKPIKERCSLQREILY